MLRPDMKSPLEAPEKQVEAETSAKTKEAAPASVIDTSKMSEGKRAALELAVRHPSLVHRLIICSGFYAHAGLIPESAQGQSEHTIQSARMWRTENPRGQSAGSAAP